ncbi:hypothetical protein BDD12DRAFT_817892 [Trichophaea hybrida]|nr:hypothetical protein BDD12DRAFT_817892 [Trichophaea hybrida]
MSASTPTSTSNQLPAPLPLPSSLVPTITPASLQSLAIYNPSLGPTDESLPDQLVFYTSRRGSAVTENEKLRQIGLAQGIAEFARGFSTTDNCTSVETQKSRVVTLELEGGWWVHAQIELTYIYNPIVQPPTTEYSSREVAPPQLLLAQLKKAHAQFCFLYGTMAMNWERLDRVTFCRRLEKYWLRWAWVRWEVMLWGSPAVDILGDKAISMAGGRLGKEIEKHERDFMVEWAKKEKVRGLVDMVVSRFGEADSPAVRIDASGTTARGGSGLWFWHRKGEGTSNDSKKSADELPPTLMPSDGCIFKGIDALEVKEVTNYLSELYEKGDDAYAVSNSGVRRKKRKKPNEPSRLGISSGESSPRRSTSTVRLAREGSDGPKRSGSNLGKEASENPTETTKPPNPISPSGESGLGNVLAGPSQGEDTEDTTTKLRSLAAANGKILNLLTFGWSSRVNLGRSTAPAEDTGDSTTPEDNTEPTETETTGPPTETAKNEDIKRQRGSFLVGFQGDLDLEDIDDDHEDSSGRITSRTAWLSRTPLVDKTLETTSTEILDADRPKPPPLEEFKIVVYTNKPFIFAFLFNPSSHSLSSPSFYRSIHHQLSPLVQSLVPSPAKQSLRTISSNPCKPPFHLILLTSPSALYTTIPPIPEPGRDVPGWSRADALHVYMVILGMLQERGDRERSVRSMKGWWVNWMKLKGGRGEGFVIRRAGEGKGEVEGVSQRDVKKYLEGLVKEETG